MDITISQVVNDAILLVGWAGTLFGFGKSKWFGAAVQFVEKEKDVIVAGAEALLDNAKVANIEEQLQKSELAKLAAIGLHALGATYNTLSADQLKALALHIQTLLPVDSKFSQQDILDALQQAQKLADDIANHPLIQAANKFTQEQIAANNTPVQQ